MNIMGDDFVFQVGGNFTEGGFLSTWFSPPLGTMGCVKRMVRWANLHFHVRISLPQAPRCVSMVYHACPES